MFYAFSSVEICFLLSGLSKLLFEVSFFFQTLQKNAKVISNYQVSEACQQEEPAEHSPVCSQESQWGQMPWRQSFLKGWILIGWILIASDLLIRFCSKKNSTSSWVFWRSADTCAQLATANCQQIWYSKVSVGTKRRAGAGECGEEGDIFVDVEVLFYLQSC